MSDITGNWILMGIGLVLMIGPWILYFRLRTKQDEQDESRVRMDEENESNR